MDIPMGASDMLKTQSNMKGRYLMAYGLERTSEKSETPRDSVVACTSLLMSTQRSRQARMMSVGWIFRLRDCQDVCK